MRNTKLLIGRMGEDAVCQYLINRQHSILRRNWRTNHLEIDIISLSANGIHFVEVKSRTAPIMAEPENNVGFSKQRNIQKAALRFMAKDNRGYLKNLEAHLDVASVIFSGEKVIIKYIEDAYMPIYY